MKKLVFVFVLVAVFAGSSNFAQAKLTDAEKGTVVNSILAGDLSVLDEIHDGNAPREERMACNIGCHSMTTNPISVNACSYLLNVTQCMQAMSSLSCIWSCQ